MKKATEINRIVKGKVYSMPTFTNSYGKIVNGSNVSIKFYHEDNSSANHGIMPESLLKVILENFKDKSKLTLKEMEAISHIETAFAKLK